jgi:putative DNA primase/helicase
LIETVAAIMGTYAEVAAMDTFTATAFDRHPTDLAKLFGARLITASETEEGRRWHETRIKSLTGGDTISARFMRKDFFNYVPAFKLTFTGNFKPALHSVNEAMRRRFLIVPFLRTPETINANLVSELKPERPEILRWMLDGCLDWQAEGLIVPAKVTAATDSYFENQNTFSLWMEEFCTIDQGNKWVWETPSRLFESYAAFCKLGHIDPGTLQTFGDLLENAGFPRERKHSGRRHSGISLKNQGGRDDRDAS